MSVREGREKPVNAKRVQRPLSGVGNTVLIIHTETGTDRIWRRAESWQRRKVHIAH